MIGVIKNFMRDQCGSALTLWGFALLPLLGMVGLGVDVSLWYVYKRDAQSAADASAIAAALIINADGTQTEWEDAANGAATANGFAPGSEIALAINVPPTSGPRAGNSDFVEVIVTRTYPNAFLNLFDMDETDIVARGVAGYDDDGGEFCMLSLAPTGTGVTFTGTTDLVMNCGVAVTSTDPAALSVEGDSFVSVTDICVAGQTNINGQPTFADATPEDGCAQPSDPLSGLAPPPDDVCGCDETNFAVSGGGNTVPLSPGVYCNGINVSGSNNVLDLAPGVYIIAGGGMHVGGGSNLVQGSGVTIYNTESCTGGDFGDLVFEGATDIALSAPDTEPYEGILFFNDPNPANTSNFELAGTVDTDFDGTLYWPNPGSTVDYAGEALQDQSCGLKIIAYDIIFRGTSNIVNPDPSCANDSIPIEGTSEALVRLVE